MQRTGISSLPLHTGRAPRWLFKRMVPLSGAIAEAIVDEHGKDEFLKRLSDPYWFQALACVIGFDFHSSGTTTTTCGALKQSVNRLNIGVFFAGGKGKASKNTLSEIENSGISTARADRLKYASRMTAKVDTALIQDSYQLYHHVFAFTEKGSWAVVQQGMNDTYARRYHWLSSGITSFVNEPGSAICCDSTAQDVLDMSAAQSEETRKTSLDLVNDNPRHLEKYIKSPAQQTLDRFNEPIAEIAFTPRHTIVDMSKRNLEMLKRAYEFQPKDYEELVSLNGIGAKSIRSLALISEVVYGTRPSWKDPVKYSFAHGGKDGIPYPVDRKVMDSSTEFLENAISQAKLGEKDKINAIKRLRTLF